VEYRLGFQWVSLYPSRTRARACIANYKDSDEERWRSEAIQVGGLGSKRGVVGIWYDKSFDPHGPAGPTAFWKIKDAQISEVDEDDEDMELEEGWIDLPA